MILVSKRFLRLFTGKFAQAITLWPFIVLKSEHLRTDKELINHEKIHLRQQIELFLIGFYLWYLLEFLMRLKQKKNFLQAYYAISFEREAYTHDRDLSYLKHRPFFAFFKYI